MLERQINLHKNLLFASLDLDLHLERIAGGNESEVYSTDDDRFVVKLKNDPYPTLEAALREAQKFRAAAESFVEIVGREHSTPSYFLIAGNDTEHAYIVIVQPYLKESSPLFYLDYATLSVQERHMIASQLVRIIRRSLISYWHTGIIPDIYGRSASSPEERAHRKSLSQLPARLWSFLIKRTLLRSHNLLFTADQEIRLIDYDPVRRSPLYKRIYYLLRFVLLFRDLLFIWLMKHTGRAW